MGIPKGDNPLSQVISNLHYSVDKYTEELSMNEHQLGPAVSAHSTMVRQVASGRYGPARVAPIWLGEHGGRNFVKWYNQKNYPYKTIVVKDLIVDTMLFSPDTCTVVPRRFWVWFSKALQRYQLTEDAHKHWVVNFFGPTGERRSNPFHTKDEAITWWKSKVKMVLEQYEADLIESHPDTLKRIDELIERTINKTSPVHFVSRRQAKHNQYSRRA